MKTNYHTHTKRCKHAYGEDEEYVKSAIKGGYSVLGFADHTPWPFNDGYVSPMRMEQDQLSSYVESINSLKSLYSNQIELKVGLECEYCKDYINWLFEIKEQYNLDYLLFGNHFPNGERSVFYTAQDQKLYVETSIQAMRTGLFECMAHPEALFKDPNLNESTKDIFRELVRAAKEFDVVLELNTSLKFRQELWEIISDEECKVVIGLDAHKPDTLDDNAIYTQALINLKSVNIVPITDIMQSDYDKSLKEANYYFEMGNSFFPECIYRGSTGYNMQVNYYNKALEIYERLHETEKINKVNANLKFVFDLFVEG